MKITVIEDAFENNVERRCFITANQFEKLSDEKKKLCTQIGSKYLVPEEAVHWS